MSLEFGVSVSPLPSEALAIAPDAAAVRSRYLLGRSALDISKEGSRIHAVPIGKAVALCKVTVGLRYRGWKDSDDPVNCPTCAWAMKMLARRAS